MKRVCTILIVLLMLSISYASKTTAVVDGDWFSVGTWDNGIPACGDTIIIDTGIIVIVSTPDLNMDEVSNPACSTPVYVEISGTLQFQAGFKAYFPCNSHIILTDSGSIIKGTGWGSSSIIQICQTTVWMADDGDIFGPSSIGPGLPITLKYFKAIQSSEGVELQWATLTEINNDYFTIERSYDIKKIEEIIRVKGAGNSRELLTYKATDLSPGIGVIYYRLKQTDFNGSFSYSDWDAVDFNTISNYRIRILQTFSPGLIFIELNDLSGEKAVAEAYSTHGALICQYQKLVNRESFLWNIDLGKKDLDGIIIIKVTVAGIVHQSKILIQSP